MRIETAGVALQDLQSTPRVSEACDAVVEVEKVIEKDGVIVLVLLVIFATKVRQVGRMYTEYLNLPNGKSSSSEELKKRVLRFLRELGLITNSQIESGEPLEFDSAQLVGRRAVVQFVDRKDSRLQISFYGIWALDSPDAPQVNG